MTAVAVDLPAHLEQARAAETPLREAVAVLESELREALGRQDYAAAERAHAGLPAARQALVVAEAGTAALAAGERRIAEAQAADRAAIEAQRLRDEARSRLPQHADAEREGMAELERLRTQITEGIRSVQADIRAVFAREAGIGEARLRLAEDRIACGDLEGPLIRPVAPNRVSAYIQSDPLLYAVLAWKG